MPYTDPTTIGGITYLGVAFLTRSLPCITFLYDLFTINGKKVIKPELIFYLNLIALAHWAMCDGSRSPSGFIFCSDCFTIQEVVILINILYINFGISCRIHMADGKPRIYVPYDQFPKFREIVTPYFVPSMMYKLRDHS